VQGKITSLLSELSQKIFKITPEIPMNMIPVPNEIRPEYGDYTLEVRSLKPIRPYF
jgi:hypothetical protein